MKSPKQTLAFVALALTMMLPLSAFAVTGSYDGDVIKPDANDEFTFDATDGDTITLDVDDENLTSIDLVFDGDTSETCTATASTTLPDDAGSVPDADLYIYFDIDCDVNDVLAEATIYFTVTKAWLEDNGYEADEVTLLHYTGSDWVELATQIVSETDTVVNYSAVTSSFSAFSVTGGIDGLADTGFNTWILLIGGAVLVLGGGSLVLKSIKVKS